MLDICSSDCLAVLVHHYRAAHSHKLIRLSSKADTGIFDAWNQGIKLARGTFLWVIGADDEFVSPGSLKQLLDLTVSSEELISYRQAYSLSDGQN